MKNPSHSLLLPVTLLLCACAASPTVSSPPVIEKVATRALLEPGDLPEGSERLAATGDIADCRDRNGAAAQATANLLLTEFPEVSVIAPGDLAYRNGTDSEFANCYDRVWGGLKNRTRPSPGNHDYGIYPPAHRKDAVPYFDYFGANAGAPGDGYYSFDLGNWHIVSLNSMAGEVAAAPSMQKQIEWLEADLSRNRKPCVLAFWHHPLFSSGEHGYESSDPGRNVAPLWKVLYENRADVIVNGHDHHYERFALQAPGGTRNNVGIRQFIVGNGGAHIRRIQGLRPNSEKHLDRPGDHGALLLTLHKDSYEWTFYRTNRSIGDASQEPQGCHPKSESEDGE